MEKAAKNEYVGMILFSDLNLESIETQPLSSTCRHCLAVNIILPSLSQYNTANGGKRWRTLHYALYEELTHSVEFSLNKKSTSDANP